MQEDYKATIRLDSSSHRITKHAVQGLALGHHTGGPRLTVHQCPLRWRGCGLLTNSTPVSRLNEPK